MKKQYTILLLCLVGFIFYYGFMHWLGIYPFLIRNEWETKSEGLQLDMLIWLRICLKITII